MFSKCPLTVGNGDCDNCNWIASNNPKAKAMERSNQCLSCSSRFSYADCGWCKEKETTSLIIKDESFEHSGTNPPINLIGKDLYKYIDNLKDIEARKDGYDDFDSVPEHLEIEYIERAFYNSLKNNEK